MQFHLVAALALGTTLVLGSLAPVPAPSTSSTAIAPALDVVCPVATVKVICGMPFDPSVAGTPEVSGGCPPYDVTFSDTSTTPQACQAERFVQTVTRTWTITDQCGNSATCRQDIHVVKELVSLDLHPRSCPNPLNRSSNGKFPAAILGTADLDVTQIVRGSLKLYPLHCQGGTSIAPIPSMTTYEDVAAPYTAGDECGCTTAGPDGYLDLIFKFDQRAMVQALGLNSYPNGTMVKLTIVGDLADGCRFIGLDCVRVQ